MNRAHSVKASMTAVYSLVRRAVLIILVATRVFRACSMVKKGGGGCLSKSACRSFDTIL